ALPWLFDADRRFGLARKTGAERAQFGRAAHHVVDKEAVNDRLQAAGQIDVIVNELIGYAAGEPVAPALRIEPYQMVAVFPGFTDPQFADYTAIGKNFLHWVS